MPQPQRGPVGMNGGPGPGMYPSPHHMRLPGPQQGRLPTAQPRLNGQPYPPMMQPQLQRPVSTSNGQRHVLCYIHCCANAVHKRYLDKA